MRVFVAWIVLITCSVSCEKDIQLQPEDLAPNLVVDGLIESGQPPVIFLTTSLSYFSSINPGIIAGSQVHDANISISDGSKSYELSEYKQDLPGGYTLSYYSVDSSNPSNVLIGKEGKTYTMKIDVNGQQYSSVTQIPELAKKLDTLWWKPAPGATDSLKVVVMTRVTDPPGYGNYIRYFTKVNSGPFLPGANSSFDDQIVDGTTYDIQVDQGIDRNNPPKFEDYGFFSRGDTVTIKFCNIDKATFDFWRTIEYSYQSVGNPFSTPTMVLGNVSNGALGAFCGYAVQYKSFVIPK